MQDRARGEGKKRSTKHYFSCTKIRKNGMTSTDEVKVRVVMAKAAMWKIWFSRVVLFKAKHQLVISIVVSMLLFGCEAWTCSEEIEKRLRALEMRCYRRML